jgi:hypothetical protein
MGNGEKIFIKVLAGGDGAQILAIAGQRRRI